MSCPRRSFVSGPGSPFDCSCGVGFAQYHGSSPHCISGIIAPTAPALESTFQQHGESLGPILHDIEFGALPTKRALCIARNELYPKAREVLPPFDIFVSTPYPGSRLLFLSPSLPADSISRTYLRDSPPSSSWPYTSLSYDVCGVFMWPPVGSSGDPPSALRSRGRAYFNVSVRCDLPHHS